MLAPLFFFVLSYILTGVASESKFNPLRHLAGTSPPFDDEPSPFDLDSVPPQGCNVTRVSYLVRHAAINSNGYEYNHFIRPFLDKIENAQVDWSTTPNFSFLSTWRNPILGNEQEKISQSGKLQAMKFGVEIAQRYNSLRKPKKLWSASSKRTMTSAEFFTKGLVPDPSEISLISVHEGKKEGANTLAPYESCPMYQRSTGTQESLIFREFYTRPIIHRFRTLAPGFDFTAEDIYALSLICGYETLLRGSSPFCTSSILSKNEWLGFEYTNDIRYFYNSGYGSPISGAVGFPWLNASLNALMSKHDTESDKTADQDMFISFTHRGLPPMVLVALGLFNNSAHSGANNILSTMPLTSINYQRVWKSSNIIPFLTDIGIEKLECDSFSFDKGTYYRVLVNNKPHSLPDCHDGPSETCHESTMVKWLKERGRIAGDFDTTCKVNYDNSTNILSIYK